MAHHNTVFSQILKLFPRHEFSSLAKKHDGHRRSDAMSRWTQFVAMATAQLSGRSSLRDINNWGQSKIKSKRFKQEIEALIGRRVLFLKRGRPVGWRKEKGGEFNFTLTPIIYSAPNYSSKHLNRPLEAVTEIKLYLP